GSGDSERRTHDNKKSNDGDSHEDSLLQGFRSRDQVGASPKTALRDTALTRKSLPRSDAVADVPTLIQPTNSNRKPTHQQGAIGGSPPVQFGDLAGRPS